MTNKNPSIYSPEFIPFYRDVQKKYDLTDKETLVYGFIRFYIKTVKADRFYFDNDGIANIVGFKHPQNVSDAISKLEKLGFIGCSYEIKANGGKVRFIEWKSTHPKETRLSPTTYSDQVVQLSPTKSYDLVHSINKNKINISKSENNSNTSDVRTIIKKAPKNNRLVNVEGNPVLCYSQTSEKGCGKCAYCSLMVLLPQQIYELAVKKKVGYEDIKRTQDSLIAWIQDGRMKSKTFYRTLATWIDNGIMRGTIRELGFMELEMMDLKYNTKLRTELEAIHQKLVKGEIKL